jgi:hypothetical protein
MIIETNDRSKLVRINRHFVPHSLENVTFQNCPFLHDKVTTIIYESPPQVVILQPCGGRISYRPFSYNLEQRVRSNVFEAIKLNPILIRMSG